MQILHISTISMLSFSMYTLALPAPHPEAPGGSGADVLSLPTSLSSNEKTLAAIPDTKLDLGADKLAVDGKKEETKGGDKLALDGKKEETKAGLGENELKKKDAKGPLSPLGDVKTPGSASGEIPEQCRQYVKGGVESPPKPTEPKNPPKVTPPKVTPPVPEAPKKSPEPPTKTSSAISGKIQGTQAVFTTAFSSSVLVYAIAAIFL